jgi:hypothetical protein
MDLLNAQDLTQLSDERGGLRISVFLPTDRAGAQTDRDRIRLKNSLRQAEQVLRGDGMSAAQTDQILQPARELLDRTPLWQRPSDGLAVFVGPGGMRHLRVPLRLPELVAVGRRFLVQPLLPLLTASARFYVLTLNQDEIGLFRGDRYRLDEVTLDGLGLAVWLTMPRRRAEVHAFVADRGGVGSHAVFHGVQDDHSPLVLQHFRRVDRALREVLDDGAAPLVLAGVRSTQALYRQVNTHTRLVGEGVDGTVRDMGLQQLHRLAWPLVEPMLRREETAAAARYRELQGTGRTSTDVTDVGNAARHGRIETLFLRANDSAAAGAPRTIRLNENVGMDDSDVAAISTLRHSGTVYAVPRHRMPDVAPLAATLRY